MCWAHHRYLKKCLHELLCAILPTAPTSIFSIKNCSRHQCSKVVREFPVEDFTQPYALCLDASFPPSIAAQRSISQKFWEQELVTGDAVILFCCHLRATEQGGVREPGTCLPESAWLSQPWVRTESSSPEGQG